MARVSWLICFLKVKAKKDGSLRKNSVSTLAREVRWQKKEKKKRAHTDSFAQVFASHLRQIRDLLDNYIKKMNQKMIKKLV